MRHLPLPRPVLYELWHAVRWPRVDSATDGVDVVHAIGGAIPAARAPLVVTVHDLAFLHHPDLFTRHGLRFFERALELTRDLAAAVCVPSMATLEDCVSAGIERSRIHHVPWGVGTTCVGDGDVAAARERFGITGRYVVVVGTREPRKNLNGLLRAWRRLDRDTVDLVVVGPAGWGDAVDPDLLDDRVTITGFVEGEVRDALYRGAVVSAYPSLFEGFGLPVLESMALGCPVVTSSGTATGELVATGGGVAVDPRDPDAIAGALARFLDDASFRDEEARRAGEIAGSYTWDRTAEQTLDCYRGVVR